MTSVLRIRRRHRLPEGNLGLSKLSYGRKLALANSYCLAISVTASAQNVAPVVTTRLRHSRFLLARRRARLISPRRFPIRTRRMRCSWACRFPQARGIFTIALDGQKKPVTVGNFLNYVNFGRYFATDATSCKAADLSARSIQPNPPSWSPSQWEITLPLSGELGQCLPGSPYSRSIRNRSVTL